MCVHGLRVKCAQVRVYAVFMKCFIDLHEPSDPVSVETIQTGPSTRARVHGRHCFMNRIACAMLPQRDQSHPLGSEMCGYNSAEHGGSYARARLQCKSGQRLCHMPPASRGVLASQEYKVSRPRCVRIAHQNLWWGAGLVYCSVSMAVYAPRDDRSVDSMCGPAFYPYLGILPSPCVYTRLEPRFTLSLTEIVWLWFSWMDQL